MSGPDFATLRRLAALKAQKAQRALAEARREADRAGKAIRETDLASRFTYEAPEEADAWIAQWRLRAALEEMRGLQVKRHADLLNRTKAPEAAARRETARELGAATLEADQTALKRRQDARQMDRMADNLASLRKPRLR